MNHKPINMKLFLFYRTSELIALLAVSTTLFLFIHTRDLNTKLKEMEVKFQPDNTVSGNQLTSGNIAYKINSLPTENL